MNEVRSREAVESFKIIGSQTEKTFDDVTGLASELLEMPYAMITFVEGSRVWIKSLYGLSVSELWWDRASMFCNLPIEREQTVQVFDATKDSRFADNIFVHNPPYVRSYVGTPLITQDGTCIGSLCVFGTTPREVPISQIRALEKLASHLIHLLENRQGANSKVEAARILELLNSVSVAANESHSPRDGITKCIEEVCRYTKASVGHYFEIDRHAANRLASSGLWYSTNDNAHLSFKIATETISFVKGFSLPGQAFESAEPVWDLDVSSDPLKARSIVCKQVGFKSAFAFPVKIKDEVIGVFEFFLEDVFSPDDHLMRLMKHVGTQLARLIERSRAEDALEKQKEFLDAVLDNLADGIVACDAQGKLTLFNRATKEFHGIDRADIPTDQWPQYFQLFHADGATLMKPNEIPLLRAFNGEILKEAEMVIATNSGLKRNILCSGRSLMSKDGRRLGAVLAMNNVTEKRNALNQLEATSKVLQTLIDHAPVGIFVVDESTRLTMWNPACEKIFGWSESEVIGEYLPHLSLEEREFVRGSMQEQGRTGVKVENQVEVIRRDGQKIHIHYSAVPLFNEFGVNYAHMSVVLDISKLKEHERDLLSSNRALRAATEAKSEFLANMSHEIRTPLNGVIGMTELLLDSSLDEDQRTQLEVLQSSAENLLTIISDILDFSKVEAGKLDLEQVEFDLDTISGEVHRTLEASAKQKGLKLSRAITGEMSTRFVGDPGRIRQVLMNLINNAIKFTSSGSVNTVVSLVAAANNQTKIRLEIRDSGIGIGKETVERLFKPFSQADSSTTRKFGGTGLGLSISRRLVELMGGEIGVTSVVGQGSTFWFTLDLDNAAVAEVIEARRAPRDRRIQMSAPLRILVAEDNATNQMITIEMLQRLGLSASTVENGAQALEELQANKYDLVLMDCQMPEMDGYQASKLIREEAGFDSGELAIIAMTANAMKGDREKCLAAGMNDYLSKPVRLDELEAAILRNIKRAA